MDTEVKEDLLNIKNYHNKDAKSSYVKIIIYGFMLMIFLYIIYYLYTTLK